MDHLSVYGNLLLITTVILCTVTTARIAFFLCRRWGMYNHYNKLETRGFWFVLSSSAATAFLIYHIAVVSITVGGSFYGMVLVFAGAVATGASWVYILGGLKIIEQILAGFEKRLVG